MKTRIQINPPRCDAKGMMRWRGDVHDRAVRAHLKWRALVEGASRHAGSAHTDRVKRISDAWAAMSERSA